MDGNHYWGGCQVGAIVFKTKVLHMGWGQILGMAKLSYIEFINWSIWLVCSSTRGWNHIMPPKNCNHKNKNSAFDFFWVDVDITSWIIFVHFKYISLTLDLKLAYLKRNSNKHLQTWTYEVYLCQKNTRHIIWKLQIYFKTKVMGEIL
jgi:hypothetical protein